MHWASAALLSTLSLLVGMYASGVPSVCAPESVACMLYRYEAPNSPELNDPDAHRVGGSGVLGLSLVLHAP